MCGEETDETRVRTKSPYSLIRNIQDEEERHYGTP